MKERAMVKEILQKPDSFFESFTRKPGAEPHTTHYCPGCGHGVIHKLIAEAMDDFGIRERTVFISPVGCSVFAYYYFNCGNVQVAHGRAPAVATAIKRALPHAIVLSYQGDGDLAAIGGNNILQAANRGENITVIFVNNAIYGMTGSQMAPTTLIGQKTTTTPLGRTVENEGYPLRMCELLATLEAPVYIERVAITDSKHVMQARKAIRKGIQNQIDGRGFSFIEVLSPCPTGWKMTPSEAKKWVDSTLMEYFKIGMYKDKNGALKPSDGAPPKLEKKPAPTKSVAKKTAVPSASSFDSAQDEAKSLHGERSRTMSSSKGLFGKTSGDELLAILGATKEDSATKLTRPKVDENYRNPRVKVAGFGGQGILLLGQLMAESAMVLDYHSTWLPSYGPEMRGGTANCHVIISEKRIGSPLVAETDVLMAMNLPSLDKFENDVRPDGVIFVNSSLITRKVERSDVQTVYVPATGLADELGETRVANMVMLGAYIGYTGLLSLESVLAAAKTVIKRKEFMVLNEKALKKGMAFAKAARLETAVH
jgi:2-oxoisovalerate ferredoxin oxidoreductase beta subunit